MTYHSYADHRAQSRVVPRAGVLLTHPEPRRVQDSFGAGHSCFIRYAAHELASTLFTDLITKRGNTKLPLFVMVPRAGVEPAWPCDQRILSPPCIPFHHRGMYLSASSSIGNYWTFGNPTANTYELPLCTRVPSLIHLLLVYESNESLYVLLK